MSAPRPLPRAFALLALAAACHGAGATSPAAPKPTAAASPEVAASAPAVARKAGPRGIELARDPMEVLRERLAAKLGATRAPDGSPANVLRVVAKAGAPVAGTSATDAAPRPKPAAPRRAPAAGSTRAAHEPHPAHWDYSGSGGPAHWGRMSSEFATCATGKRQSPIDIRDGIRVDLEPIRFDYQPTAFRVIDNGHTVQVNLAAGNAIEVMGRRYELVQFHFHRPSEERVNGKQFDMVVHLVHKSLDGHLAVIAVLLERGRAQPIVQSVWNNLPLEKGEELAARTLLNPAELLPAVRDYATYMGSLTTPPCSEGVLWMVMKQPVPVSDDQIGIFTRLYPMNARPIQPTSDRLIKESN
jgi:carbonic anhydrase